MTSFSKTGHLMFESFHRFSIIQRVGHVKSLDGHISMPFALENSSKTANSNFFFNG